MTQNSLAALASILAVAYLALLPGSASAEDNFLVDLGAIAPAIAIDNSGDVLFRTYVYRNSALIALPAGFSATSINGKGDIGGASYGLPALLSGGVVTTFPDPDPTGSDVYGSAVQAVNDNGQFAFTDVYMLGIPRSYLYSNGTEAAIPVFLGGTGLPCDGNHVEAINDAGQTTGFAASPTEGCDFLGAVDEAYIYDGTTLTDLGPGEGHAINDNGDVTGIKKTVSESNNEETVAGEAFLYSGGNVTAVPGTNNCTGYGINNDDVVVGTCAGTAFMYADGETTVDLNTRVLSTDPLKPYVSLRDARGINDSGMIAVNGIDSRDHLMHAYVFVPQKQSLASGAPPGKSSGGGRLDLRFLVFLLGLVGCRTLVAMLSGYPSAPQSSAPTSDT